MLDTLTKRRIDIARDILVGKLPDPKSQVEQITIALIYKFMDDMDKQSEELGGEATFFTGEYEKYSWSKIFDPRVSGYERINLYGEAIQKMNHNPNIPQLFRNIFKNAYLPYRDPETLKMFLKVIGEFEYDHSEKLGDAFEYLLSIMGSQGDAGQFRTPRHIIDFMVKVVDPCKNETILDPACGTAGFLISSFNHILNKNKKDNRLNLTADERTRLINSFSGYDISPDMVRLSLVNMYLHKFPAPKIYEYDTLTSEEKWNEFYDIILANPPFMSPKGGIRPHKRFSIQAKRSEVLFVDYIAEHLNPNGRGGVIVPEGIIFQSGIAYKKLRKMLIENSLYVVVSLPAGVFNPYSGVKTSILFLNKNLSKKTDKILFVKVNHDGFGLGAQRREIKENDLPLALEIIKKYKQSIIEGKEIEFNLNEAKLANIVKKEKIAESGDYNLSGDRYKEAVVYSGKWNFVELGELCDFKNGLWKGKKEPLKKVNILRNTNFTKTGVLDYSNVAVHPIEINQLKTRMLEYGDIILEKSGGGPTQPVGRVALFCKKDGRIYSYSNFTARIRVINESKINPIYLWRCLHYLHQQGVTKNCQNRTSGIRNLDLNAYKKIRIPLPLLEVQEQIVAELESYQKIIDGARQVVENYKPSFKIDSNWETVELGKVAEIISGQSPEGKHYNQNGNGFPFYQGKKEFSDMYISKPNIWTTQITKIAKKGDILMSVRAPVGPVNLATQEICIGRGLAAIRSNNKIEPMYLFIYLKFIEANIYGNGGSVFDSIGRDQIKKIIIPLPSIEIQQKIIAQIEKEQKTINANKELITIFENKIKDKIAEVWGE